MTQLLRLALLVGPVSGCVTEVGIVESGIDAPPAVALGDLPIVHGRALSPRMELALATVEHNMALEMPDPPADPTIDSLTSWLADTGVGWIVDRGFADREAHRQLEAAAYGVEEQIIAAAVTGLLFEDRSRHALSIPTPREIVEVQRRVAGTALELLVGDPWQDAMSPLAPTAEAAAAYRRCADLAASAGPEFDDYWLFCEGREANLPDRPMRLGDEYYPEPIYEALHEEPSYDADELDSEAW
jgi:hypothetical protein